MNSITIPPQRIECPALIAGKWVHGDGAPFTVTSPYTGGPVGEVRATTSQELELTLKNAYEAFQDWSTWPLKERCQMMFKVREELLKNIADISQVISLESGKTLAESKAGLLKGIEVLEFALSLQNRDEGGKMEVSRGVSCEYRRRPLGVVAGITPFNFPAMVPLWMLPIALVLGNAFVWKPSEKTPLTSQKIGEAFMTAGLPPGILSIVHGGPEIVSEIIQAPNIKALGFVGSTPVAQKIYTEGSRQGKRVLALGGAKNHIFLLPDASVEISAKGIRDSFTGCAGQRCMAATVLLALPGTDPLIEKIVEAAREIQLGTGMGAIITAQQVEFLHRAIEKAEREGASILLDGRRGRAPAAYSSGHWLGPTIIDQVKPNFECAQKELFGPILSIIRCQNLTEALKIENANPFGNAASVFTNHGAAAQEVVQKASAGMVGINIGVPVPREPFSFGGINASKFGHGDITGPASLNFWTDLQKVTTKWQGQEDHNWMS